MLCVAAALLCQGALAAPRVELELVTQEGFAITGQQKWLRMLSELQFDRLRIRQASGSETIEVKRAGSERAPVYQVTGALTRGDLLVLPGGRFSIRDKGRIAAWKAQLLRSGPGGIEPRVRAAFGLSSEQLVAMHQRLAAPVVETTKGKTPKEIVRSVARTLPGGVTIDPDVTRSFEGQWTTPEEMNNLSAGTVLAATIRPMGLVLVPQAVSETNVRLIITDVRKAGESWPVGWPPEKNERELAPKLFEFFTFEAPGNPLTEALAALQANLELPLLFDHNGLARHRIDVAKTMITYPASRSYYKKVLDRVLFQAKLKAEVRVDEAGEPFIWVAPIKR